MNDKNQASVSGTENILYERIRELVVAARQTVARGVDLVQVHTNFEIGHHIVEQEQQGEQRAGYGKAVIKRLADKLTQEFGRGFSKSNLEYMRRFYLLYQDRVVIAQSDIGQSHITSPSEALRHEAVIAQFQTGQSSSVQTRPFHLSWTHYVFLMGINNADERSFYEIETADQGWNTVFNPIELDGIKNEAGLNFHIPFALSLSKGVWQRCE